MIKVVVRVPDEMSRRVLMGSEDEVSAQLRGLFPTETQNLYRLSDLIEAIQGTGSAEVTLEVVTTKLEENLLPVDFLIADQGEDPWPRRG